MEHRHLWLRSPRQAAILRVRAEIIKAARDFFDERGFILTDPPILTPAACEGTTTLVSGGLLRRAGLPDAVRPALHRSHGHGAGQGVLVRADLSRGEIEDAPAPDRILDGRAGSRLSPSSTTSWSWREELAQLSRPARASRSGAPTCKSSGATSPSWRRLSRRFRASRYDEAVKMLQEAHAKGALENKFEWGGDFGSPDETYHFVAVRPAGDGASLSRPGEGVLHGARPAAPGRWRCAWMCWRRKATARSSAARSAWPSYDLLLQRIHEHGLPEEAFKWYLDLRKLRQRAARRLRHGHRARGGLDLRPGTRARDDSVSADAAPAVSVKAYRILPAAS